jgi:1-phosphofructokinase
MADSSSPAIDDLRFTIYDWLPVKLHIQRLWAYPKSDMLLTLTPNPAIDRILLVPGFRQAEVARVAEVRESAGGKGLNVTRVARVLGLPVRACGPLAGVAGRRIAELALAEAIDAHWSWLARGESRTCTLVLDLEARDALLINERGPDTSSHDWDALANLVQAEAEHVAAVAISGSLTPGVAAAQLIALLGQLAGRVPVYLDTSGAALVAALDLPLDLLKVNAEELGAALGAPIATLAEALAAAAHVQARGPAKVIVTLGRDGAVAVGAGGAWLARSPEVVAINAIGSGDALLAGVATALIQRRGLAAALRLGVACGAANTLTIGSGMIRPADVDRLHDETTLIQLP